MERWFGLSRIYYREEVMFFFSWVGSSSQGRMVNNIRFKECAASLGLSWGRRMLRVD
jgi:hypothetical protein